MQTYSLTLAGNAIEIEDIRVLELDHDNCLLQKFDPIHILLSF